MCNGYGSADAYDDHAIAVYDQRNDNNHASNDAGDSDHGRVRYTRSQ
jgi:hypothetical protein